MPHTHLAWIFRACSMSSRAPTYWEGRECVSQARRPQGLLARERGGTKGAGPGGAGSRSGGGALVMTWHREGGACARGGEIRESNLGV